MWKAIKTFFEKTDGVILMVFLIIVGSILIKNSAEITPHGITMKKTAQPKSELNFEYNILSSYYDVQRDAIVETERSNATLKQLFVTAFQDFIQTKCTRIKDTTQIQTYVNYYRLLLSEQMDGPIMDITLKSAFRNHFPRVSDTIAVKHHTEYVASSILTLSVTDISQKWTLYFPKIPRTKYIKYMKNNRTFDMAIKVKALSMLRIEQRKLQIINAMQSSYPDATEQFIKLRWSAMYK